MGLSGGIKGDGEATPAFLAAAADTPGAAQACGRHSLLALRRRAVTPSSRRRRCSSKL